MRHAITFLLLFCCLLTFAQTQQNVDYYKNNGTRVSTVDSADFIRVVNLPDPGSALYKVKEFYPNQKLKLVGESLTTDLITLEGRCLSYYNTGNKQSVLLYSYGKLKGDQYYYHPNGKLSEVRNYPALDKIRVLPLSEQYTTTEAFDTTGTAVVTNGNGHYKAFMPITIGNSSTQCLTEGDLKNGFREGVWKSSVNKDSIILTETYQKGKLITGNATFADGQTSTYTKAQKLPEFESGTAGFSRYLGRVLRYPAEAQRNNIQGRVNVAFIIEQNGTLTNAKIAPGSIQNESLQQEAIKAIKDSPKWIPGSIFGRPARVSYVVPVIFALGR